MSGTSTVGRRIIGAVVGLLAGGVAMGALSLVLFKLLDSGVSEDEDYALLAFFVIGSLGFLIGAIIGAAGGATIIQKIARERSSLWRALLGAAIGLLAGELGLTVLPGIPGPVPTGWAAVVIVPASIVAGAVLGSGWKAKAANATGSSS